VRRRIIAGMTIAAGLLAAFGCSSSGEASITGTVTYRQRIALPDDAVITVQLRDVSKADVAATVLGEQIIKTEGKQVPIPYQVSYDESEIDDRFSYSMSARIEDGSGRLLFISDTHTPVITRDSPTEDVEILVVPVSP
jgi:putative lipoprotein